MLLRIQSLTAALLLMTAATGCESLTPKWPHELQAHRLWRLNRQSDTQRNVYYSVPDNIPELSEVKADDE